MGKTVMSIGRDPKQGKALRNPSTNRHQIAKYELYQQQGEWLKANDLALDMIKNYYSDSQDHPRIITWANKIIDNVRHVDKRLRLGYLLQALHYKGTSLISEQKFDGAIKCLDQYRLKAVEAGDMQARLSALFYLGVAYLYNYERETGDSDDLEEANDFSLEAKRSIKSADNQDLYSCDINLNLSIIARYQQKYEEALKYIGLARTEAKKLPFDVQQDRSSLVYQNMATLFEDQNDIDRAIQSNKRQIAALESIGGDTFQAEWDLGNRYRQRGKYEISLDILERQLGRTDHAATKDDIRKDIQKTKNLLNMEKDLEGIDRKLNNSKSFIMNRKAELSLLEEKSRLLKSLSKYEQLLQCARSRESILTKTKSTLWSDWENVYLSLADAYALTKDYKSSIAVYEKLRSKTTDNSKKMSILKEYGAVLQSCDASQSGKSFEYIVRVYMDLRHLAEPIGDSKMEKEALENLHDLYSQRNYKQKLPELESRLEELEKDITPDEEPIVYSGEEEEEGEDVNDDDINGNTDSMDIDRFPGPNQDDDDELPMKPSESRKQKLEEYTSSRPSSPPEKSRIKTKPARSKYKLVGLSQDDTQLTNDKDNAAAFLAISPLNATRKPGSSLKSPLSIKQKPGVARRGRNPVIESSSELSSQHDPLLHDSFAKKFEKKKPPQEGKTSKAVPKTAYRFNIDEDSEVEEIPPLPEMDFTKDLEGLFEQKSTSINQPSSIQKIEETPPTKDEQKDDGDMDGYQSDFNNEYTFSPSLPINIPKDKKQNTDNLVIRDHDKLNQENLGIDRVDSKPLPKVEQLKNIVDPINSKFGTDKTPLKSIPTSDQQVCSSLVKNDNVIKQTTEISKNPFLSSDNNNEKETKKKTSISSNKTLRHRSSTTTPKTINVKLNEDKFSIHVGDGPNGTPRTVRWLTEKARQEYGEIYKFTPKIQKVVDDNGITLTGKRLIRDLFDDKSSPAVQKTSIGDGGGEVGDNSKEAEEQVATLELVVDKVDPRETKIRKLELEKEQWLRERLSYKKKIKELEEQVVKQQR